jgi:hypothetical protein
MQSNNHNRNNNTSDAQTQGSFWRVSKVHATDNSDENTAQVE